MSSKHYRSSVITAIDGETIFPIVSGSVAIVAKVFSPSCRARTIERFLPLYVDKVIAFNLYKPFYEEVDLTKYPHRYGYRLTRVRDKISLKLDVCLFVVGSSLCREAHGKLPFVL